MGKKRNKHTKNKARQNGNSNDKENYEERILEVGCKSVSEVVTEETEIPVGTDDEVKFEKYYGKCERITGREYFVHSLCQVCKEEVDTREGCPKCGLVRYCSARHRRDHWPSHADLCATVQAMARDRGCHIMSGARDLSPDQFRLFRFQNMMECEERVERPLEKWEKEMFVFPNVCGECYNHEPKDLVTCECCGHSGFCQRHATESHRASCRHLRRYKSIVKNRHERGVACPSIPRCRISTTWPILTDAERFFRGISDGVDEFEFFELTEIATYPLTALNALAKLNTAKPFDKDELVLHVVGAEADFETNKLEKWEYYVLHLIPNLKNLRVEFVGPELRTKTAEFKPCSKCSLARKTITFGFHDRLYHELGGLPEPDLICAFNPGLYRATGFRGQDTWGACLPTLLSGCPLLITAYTAREARLDLGRLTASTSLCLIAEPSLNPFASLNPNLNFVSEEDSPVVFKNQFYCIVKS